MTHAEYESMTELERVHFHCDGWSVMVESLEAGMRAVANFAKDGHMSYVTIERGYFVKRAYAMGTDGNWMYSYSLEWKAA